jgi:hypothetical protein
VDQPVEPSRDVVGTVILTVKVVGVFPRMAMARSGFSRRAMGVSAAQAATIF